MTCKGVWTRLCVSDHHAVFYVFVTSRAGQFWFQNGFARSRCRMFVACRIQIIGFHVPRCQDRALHTHYFPLGNWLHTQQRRVFQRCLARKSVFTCLTAANLTTLRDFSSATDTLGEPSIHLHSSLIFFFSWFQADQVRFVILKLQQDRQDENHGPQHRRQSLHRGAS